MDIESIIKIREHKLAEFYNVIYTVVKKKIKEANNAKYTSTEYYVPENIKTINGYCCDSCSIYIIKRLRDDNYEVNFEFPNKLYISWEHLYKMPEYHKLDFLSHEHKKTVRKHRKIKK
jgi:hypothetical protein